jgi:hypothetical protein
VTEQLLGEEQVEGISVRFLELAVEGDGGSLFCAAAAPVEDEWCFLARSEERDRLEVAARSVFEQEETREIFRRWAALLGTPWHEGEIVPLLNLQDREGHELMRRAPEIARAPIERLRAIREASGED